MEFQTRDNECDIRFHKTMQEALDYAKTHQDVWKISFTIPSTGERVRLIRVQAGWVLEDVFGNRHANLQPWSHQ